jgi:hypothetical protein
MGGGRNKGQAEYVLILSRYCARAFVSWRALQQMFSHAHSCWNLSSMLREGAAPRAAVTAHGMAGSGQGILGGAMR